VEHYKLNGWDAGQAIKFFNVRGIPKVVLVGSDGKIAYIGHPSHGNLETRINNFLENKDQ